MIDEANIPYWFPVKTDEKWIARVRSDFPEDTKDMADEYIRELYADGWKYADNWDNLQDARDSYEQLADAYLELIK